MTTPITLLATVQARQESNSSPISRTVQLSPVADQGDSASLFNDSRAGLSLTLNNLTPEAWAKFTSGDPITITLS